MDKQLLFCDYCLQQQCCYLLLTLMNVTRKPILYFSAQLSRISDTVNAHPARHCGLRPFFFPLGCAIRSCQPQYAHAENTVSTAMHPDP